MAEAAQDQYSQLSARCKGSNVNATTLLATDYLNHFNEIIMLFEMVPDMPDILEECLEWRPKSYKDHFRDSGIADRELAIEAYDHVPARYRKPFEETIAQMDQLVAASLTRMSTVLEGGNMDELRHVAVESSRALQKLSDFAGAVIHGSDRTMEQSEIDHLLGN